MVRGNFNEGVNFYYYHVLWNIIEFNYDLP